MKYMKHFVEYFYLADEVGLFSSPFLLLELVTVKTQVTM